MDRPNIRNIDTFANCLLIVLTGIILATCIGLSIQQRAIDSARDAELGEAVVLGDDWADHAPEPVGSSGTHQRSPKWPAFRARFIAKHGAECAACGSKSDLNLHHVIAFHDDPSKELDEDNCLVLCRDCNWRVGHDSDGPTGPNPPRWTDTNQNVRADAAKMRAKIKP